jgi:hypothetical protein
VHPPAQEWKRWLLLYVTRLAEDEDELRLRELLADLLGPLRWGASSHLDAQGRGWEPCVLGVISKRELLR